MARHWDDPRVTLRWNEEALRRADARSDPLGPRPRVYGTVFDLGAPLFDQPDAGWIEFATGSAAGNLAVTTAGAGCHEHGDDGRAQPRLRAHAALLGHRLQG